MSSEATKLRYRVRSRLVRKLCYEQSICVVCQKTKVPEGDRSCTACRKRRSESGKRKRKESKEKGICSSGHCLAIAEQGYKMCPHHRELARRCSILKRSKARINSVCYLCGKEKVTDKKACTKCSQRRLEYDKRHREKKALEGICTFGGCQEKARPGWRTCPYHHRQNQIRNEKRKKR